VHDSVRRAEAYAKKSYRSTWAGPARFCLCHRYNHDVIDSRLRDRVIEAIWPSPSAANTSVWAIVDCARDRRIYPALRTSGLDYRCLFSGRLSPEVEAAAPHLIEVAPAFTFTPKFIDMGWGNSWAVFLRIADPSDLRPHLRRFLRVQDESGRILFFRYYDPRVLRIYLPTCRVDELRTVFGPISSYLVEDETGRGLIEFSFDGHQLRERRIGLMPDDASGGQISPEPTNIG
jgi:hypothetical protein